MSGTLPVVDAEYFDALYGETDDPWRMRTRWYEVRKRALVEAVLPRVHFGRVFEPGCGNGLLTERLAPRCDVLLAIDLHPRAVASARDRLSAYPHVTITEAALPAGWPAGVFDLIVLSELGYYFGADDWRGLAHRCAASLADDGVVLACHWRHDFDARRGSTYAVHQTLHDAGGLHLQCTVDEPDMLLQVWSRACVTVAQREGLA
jgi:SAM-dependent methyltransferase